MNGRRAIGILAAGAGSRFGGGKLDAPFRGRPLGDHALAAACTLGRPFIVVPEAVPGFANAAQERGEAELLINRQAAKGLATSVALAARHAQENEAQALLLLLGDMPVLRPESLRLLVELMERSGTASAVRYPSGRLGIPACFPAGWFAALQGLSGDRGAHDLLNRPGAALALDIAAAQLRDIDRPGDLDLA